MANNTGLELKHAAASGFNVIDTTGGSKGEIANPKHLTTIRTTTNTVMITKTEPQKDEGPETKTAGVNLYRFYKTATEAITDTGRTGSLFYNVNSQGE